MRVEGAPPTSGCAPGEGADLVDLRTEGASESRPGRPPLLEARDVTKVFEASAGRWGKKGADEVRAVSNVSLQLEAGSVLGLAGESGSGKSVTAEMLARIQEPTSGTIKFRGEEIGRGGEALTTFRRKVSMVFQSPFDSMNPRWKIADAVAEPLSIHKVGSKVERREAVLSMLDRVGLRPPDYYAERYPHELSGGELQRAAVARALILGPDLMIADEPTTMLDVSVRAGVLNLLRKMRDEENLAMLFISHDLTTLSYLCDRIAIMYLGRVVEIGSAHDVLGERLHPYTNALAAALPLEDPDLIRPPVPIIGDLSTVSLATQGCPFAPRCPSRMDHCEEDEPVLVEAREGHFVACHLHKGLEVAKQ